MRLSRPSLRLPKMIPGLALILGFGPWSASANDYSGGETAARQFADSGQTAFLGNGWFWNPLFSYHYAGLHPFLYALELDEWMYVLGSSESSGFYLWRFRDQHWGWTSAQSYPNYVNLSTNSWTGLRDPATLVGLVTVRAGSIPNGQLNLSEFALGKYEVSRLEWNTVREWALAHGYDIGQGGGCADDHPAHSLSWYDALRWCNAKSEMDGLEPVYLVDSAVLRHQPLGRFDAHRVTWEESRRGYRLPTRQEWEYAARGGAGTRNYTYSGGNEIGAVGWSFETSTGALCHSTWSTSGTWPVGQKAANEIGLHDLSGNVQEWTWNPITPGQSDRAVRGGSWAHTAFSRSFNPDCRVTSEEWVSTDSTSNRVGFRIAANPEVFGNAVLDNRP